jgi:integrase
LAEARDKHHEYAKLVARGESPAKLKQRQKAEALQANTVKELGEIFTAQVIEKHYKRSADAKRYFTRDVYPALGHYRLKEVTPADVLRLLEAIKKRGAEHAAKNCRTLLKLLFDYGIARQLLTLNPVSAIPLKIIAMGKSRTRTLTPQELRTYLTRLDAADDSKSLKIALRLILITLVRKGELINARWEHVNFEKAEWLLPATKNGQPHIIYLCRQALALFQELKALAGNSLFVLPGRSGQKPISEHTLNVMLYRNDKFGIEDMTIHDSRRTASTLLHEALFQPDVIEKALNHSIRGIRGVYNVAQYAEQRRMMLSYWADYLDSLIENDNVVVGSFGRAA